MSTRTRPPLYLAVMVRLNAILTALTWPMFLWTAITRDWTVIFLPLTFTAGLGMMLLFLRREYGSPRRVRPQPDYPAIARMERDLFGETFGHGGAPATAAIKRYATGGPVGPRCGCVECGGTAAKHAEVISLMVAEHAKPVGYVPVAPHPRQEDPEEGDQ